jgi:hypothetical protein
MKKRTIAAALALFATVAQSAFAQQVSANSPSSISAAMQAAGYRAEVTRDDSGDPMIRSTSSGSTFAVFFYGCEKGSNCTTVQFFASYTKPANASLSSLNAFNSKNRFVRAYLSDSGSARLEMDVDLDDGGMSRELFQDNLEFWVLLMAKFEKHIAG